LIERRGKKSSKTLSQISYFHFSPKIKVFFVSLNRSFVNSVFIFAAITEFLDAKYLFPLFYEIFKLYFMKIIEIKILLYPITISISA